MKNSLIFFISLVILYSCKDMPSETYFHEGTKTINGTRLFYKIIGQGEPLLIIHGGPGLSHEYLFPHLKSLANKYQLIFYDQRVSGKSAIDVEASSITLDNFVKDIDELRKEFGIGKVNLMAHSWGGLLAMKYAFQFPENTKSLILVNSVGASSEISANANQLLADRLTEEDSLQRAGILQSEGLQNGDPETIETLMKIGFKHQFYDPSFLDSLNLSLNDNFMQTSQLLQNLAKDLTEYDFHNELANIQAPTLLIYGDYDPFVELAGRRINESINNSTLEVIDNCGHFPFIEKQDEFNKIIIPFIDENI